LLVADRNGEAMKKEKKVEREIERMEVRER